jgi:cytidine deaminase
METARSNTLKRIEANHLGMETRPLTDADTALIDAAAKVLADHFEPGRHEVSSALRTDSGQVYTAINLVTSVGTAAVHCEPITVGKAILAGESAFETTVAVTYADPVEQSRPVVISACGVCRELLRDFDPTIDVVVPGTPDPVKATVTELLPGK